MLFYIYVYLCHYILETKLFIYDLIIYYFDNFSS